MLIEKNDQCMIIFEEGRRRLFGSALSSFGVTCSCWPWGVPHAETMRCAGQKGRPRHRSRL